MDEEEALHGIVGQTITGMESVDIDGDVCLIFVLGDGRQILFPCDTICVETTNKWRLN